MKKHISANSLVAKIWSFCDTLRDDGVSYGDYLEQITYLLFLKMADEYTDPQYKKNFKIPIDCNWQILMDVNDDLLINTYSDNLKKLSSSGGMLSKIFNGAQNKINDRHKLRKLIDLINEENWINESVDIKGEIYESLLQKNAESSGAGGFFYMILTLIKLNLNKNSLKTELKMFSKTRCEYKTVTGKRKVYT